MFDFVQENKKLVQIVLLLIVLSFAFWGVDSYRQSGSTNVFASVNGMKINAQEFERALQQRQNQLSQMLGENFDAKMFDNPQARLAILDNLIDQRLLVQQAGQFGLVVTDQQVADIISNINAFQEDGKFDKKLYESLLARQQLSPIQFEEQIRGELAAQQLQDSYTKDGFSPTSTVHNIIRLNEQQRIIQIAKISFQSYVTDIKVDDTELKSYYEANQTAFQIPELAKVEYVKLSVDDLLSKVAVSDDEAHKYYDEHQNDYSIAEQRHAAHILISSSTAASATEQAAALHNAQQVLQEVQHAPTKFVSLAQQFSQDTGSAANGGDLGFFTRGTMTKPFEDAVFSLRQGEISALVKSDFGYHIIKLVAIKPGHSIAFNDVNNDVKNEIINKLRQQKAVDMYAELAEQFSNIVYEQSDTLKPAALLANSSVEQSGWLSKSGSSDGLWTAKMVQAIFSDDAIKNKRNTDAVEIAANTLVAARVIEYKPASVRPFAEVKTIITEKLSQQKAAELAIKQGKSALKQLQGGDKSNLQWGAAQTISMTQNADLDKAVVRQIFRADAAKLPQFAGVETSDGYMLMRVNAVNEMGSIDDAKRMGYTQELRRLTGEEMFRSYLNDIKQHADIKITMPQSVTTEP